MDAIITGQWLLEQIAVVVVMGIVIYAMFRYIQFKDKIIKAKDDKILEMAEKVLVVASLWDVKSNINTQEHKDILDELDTIKRIHEANNR